MTWLRWLLLLLATIIAPAAAQDFPPLTGRVVDAAHVLSAEQVAELTQLSAATEAASTRQLVVATVPSLGGADVSDYGYKLLRAWGIGQKRANNGVILLVAPTEHKVGIAVGYGLEPVVTDALSGQIIRDRIVPRFKAGDMGGGIVAGAQAVADALKAPPEQAEQSNAVAAQQGAQRRRGGNAGVLIFWGVLLFFFVVPMIASRARGRRYGNGVRTWDGSGGGGMANAAWIGANILSGLANSRGGGDWGGGGSDGGGFSGGGGSGGGGGASGSW